jgi:DNA polymerase elongation subunit (family B)
MVDLERDLYDIKGKSIAIASAVTSYARMLLYSAMTDIMAKGERILYFDTDSMITTCNLKQHDDLMAKYMWDGCGNELGALKNEALDKCKKVLSTEDLKKQTELDGGELAFDECIILAPKVYSLRKTLVNGQTIEIAKMKGVKSSTF